MKRSFLFYILTFFINKINGSTNADCYIHGVEDIQWLTEYQNVPVDDFEEIEFKRFLVSNLSDVGISGLDYGKYFVAKLLDNNLIISPSPHFKNFEINEKSTSKPGMNIRLDMTCKTSIRRLAFYQPIYDHNTYQPEFLKPSFRYTLPMPLPGKFNLSAFGESIAACDWDISNMQLDFQINPAKDFSLIWDSPINGTNNKCHKAILQTNNPLRLAFKTIYQIKVKDRGVPPRTNIAQLEVNIDESNSIPQNPQFELPYYTANYSLANEENKIVMDKPIRLNCGCAKVQLHILEYKDNFRIYCASNIVTVELITLPGEWENMVVVLVTTVAFLEKAEKPAKAVLVIKLPQQECQETNLTELQFATFLKFERAKYSFEVEPSYRGFFGNVTAHAYPHELIQYSIRKGKTTINIEKHTGRLRLLTNFNPGTYDFIVSARGMQSKIKTHAHVTIIVVKTASKSKTMNSILIEHVSENEGRFITLPCNCDLCSYEIIEQYPETNPKLFGVYSKTQLYAVPIDREMDEIISMKIPQFTLWLIFTTTGNCIWQNTSNNNSFYENREWAFIPAQIPHTRDQMLASIIIDDANDNPPVFEAGDRLIIGYPVKSLADVIAPLYLTKVTATDLDAGENAEIRYRTDSKDFIIHPFTGVIYAGDDAVKDDSNNLQFNVIATDRNGFADGLSANLAVDVSFLEPSCFDAVKPLKLNHIIVLKVKSILLEEHEVLLQKLSNKTNLQIRYLSAASIPITDSQNDSLSLPKILVYGLNSEDEPVEAYSLEAAIENCTEIVTADKLDVESLSISENIENDLDKAILITAVVILSLLLVFFVNAFLAFYYFKIYLVKKSRGKHFNNTHTERLS